MNTFTSSSHTPELLSALADGELGREECAAVLQACQHDEAAFANWSAYHFIGDVLRSPMQEMQGADPVFLGRLNLRLAQERAAGVIFPPAGLDSVTLAEGKPVLDVTHHRGRAANDGSFRWKLVAGFASVAAVSAIAWNAPGLLSPVGSPQLAQGPALQQQVLVASPQGPMVRNARLEELLAAHRQLGGASALQVPSGFLQNAAFETSQSARR